MTESRARAEREVGEKMGWVVRQVKLRDNEEETESIHYLKDDLSTDDVFPASKLEYELQSLAVSQREREIECEGLLRLVVEERTYLRDTKPEFKHLGDKLLYCKTCQYPYGGHGDACLIGEIEKFLKKGTPNAT